MSTGPVAVKSLAALLGGLSAAKPTRMTIPALKTWARRCAPLPALRLLNRGHACS